MRYHQRRFIKHRDRAKDSQTDSFRVIILFGVRYYYDRLTSEVNIMTDNMRDTKRKNTYIYGAKQITGVSL